MSSSVDCSDNSAGHIGRRPWSTRLYAYLGELCTKSSLRRERGAELEKKVSVLPELRIEGITINGRILNRWRGLRSFLMKVCAERLCHVAALYLFDLIDVRRAEELCAELRKHQRRRNVRDPFDARRLRALPIGSGNKEVPATISVFPCSDVVNVVGVEIDQLERIIPALLNRGQRDDYRLSPQIHDEVGIRSIRVGGDDSCVCRSKDAGNVVDVIWWSLVLAPFRIECKLVDAQVVLHDGKRVNICLLRNLPRLVRRRQLGVNLRPCFQ